MSDTDYAAALARYRAMMDAFPDIVVKGKANPYTSMNGNMFSFLDKTGMLCLRLSKAERTDFVEAYGTAPVEQYGAIMKEYVAVPEDLASDPSALQGWFEKSTAYAATLPAKATKRR
ncbi:MAG: hypothetical protein NXI17_15135 [Alphaproteobacteria bacterium]|nr:hypothetical protein [Alphaproteobacteria bacterium]